MAVKSYSMSGNSASGRSPGRGPEHSTKSCVLVGGAGRNTALCAVFWRRGGPGHSSLCCVLAEGGPGHSTTAPLLIPHPGVSVVLPGGFRGDPHAANLLNLEVSGSSFAVYFCGLGRCDASNRYYVEWGAVCGRVWSVATLRF